MMKDNIKHIFFDLDNTLWDHRGNSESVLSLMFKENDIQQKFKLKFEDWHTVFYELNELLWQDLREGKITKAELREKRFRAPFKYFNIEDETLSHEFEVIYLSRMGRMSGTVDGAHELLEYLEKNYTIHVITNGFIEVSEDKIVNSNMQKYISTLTCADELGVRKPDPKIFDLAMQKAESTKENSIIIGDDWIADIIGATNYGWQAIFFDVLNEGHTLEGVLVVKSLLEIKDLL